MKKYDWIFIQTVLLSLLLVLDLSSYIYASDNADVSSSQEDDCSPSKYIDQSKAASIRAGYFFGYQDKENPNMLVDALFPLSLNDVTLWNHDWYHVQDMSTLKTYTFVVLDGVSIGNMETINEWARDLGKEKFKEDYNLFLEFVTKVYRAKRVNNSKDVEELFQSDLEKRQADGTKQTITKRKLSREEKRILKNMFRVSKKNEYPTAKDLFIYKDFVIYEWRIWIEEGIPELKQLTKELELIPAGVNK